MKYKDIIYIIVIILLLVLFFHQCSEKEKFKEQVIDNIEALEDSVRIYRDKLGREVNLKKTIQLNSTKEIKELAKSNAELKEALRKFKKVNSVTEIQTVTKIKEVVINSTDTIKQDCNLEFKERNSTFVLSAKVNDNQLKIDSLMIPNKQTIVIGDYKSSIFKKSVLTTSVVNSNPLIDVKDIKSSQVVIPKKWYEKPYITIPIGVLGGVVLWESIR